MTHGKIAYEAYAKNAKGRSLVSGSPLPPFEALGKETRDSWEAAAEAVLLTDEPEPMLDKMKKKLAESPVGVPTKLQEEK
jgi:hypothetical protein